MTISATKKVGELAVEVPRAIPLFEGLGIDYMVLEDGQNLEVKVKDAVRAANALRGPFALLFAGEFSV